MTEHCTVTIRNTRSRPKRHAGFSLTEVLVVAAIIVVAAVVAVPNFIEQQHRALEARAVYNLRQIHQGQQEFFLRHDQKQYALAIGDLNIELSDIDTDARWDYRTWVVPAVDPPVYSVTAWLAPVGGGPAIRWLKIDQTGTIQRSKDGATWKEI